MEDKKLDKETKQICDEFVDDMILKEEFAEEKKKITVKTFFDKKTKRNLGVELPDGTIVLIDKKENGLRVSFPREKFFKGIEKQYKEGRKYIEMIVSKEELEIISKVIGEDNGRK